MDGKIRMLMLYTLRASKMKYQLALPYIDPVTGELYIGIWYVTYLPTQNSAKLDH